MSALQKELQKSRIPPIPPTSGASGRRGFGRKRDYTPSKWSKYYDSQDNITISERNVFRVYRAGDCGPLLVLLHGGGYSGLTWSLMAANIIKLVECQVLAIDLRGHGNTRTTDDEDLSAETMSSDVGAILNQMFGEDAPPIILIGHSMGGAIAVHAAIQRLIPSLVGLIVIDVVEGTALDALQSMQSFLRGRPSSFRSIENAIEWCLITGNLATYDIDEHHEDSNSEVSTSHPEQLRGLHRENSIPEESEEEEQPQEKSQPTRESSSEAGQFKLPSALPVTNMKYGWRIDLSKTEKYWAGWFQGLSNMFLNCSAAKMLLLAGVDRLDKDLTIGQMQGKFQMQVLPQSGHAVHEDVPEKVADVLATYMVRNKFVQPTDNFQM